MVGDRTTADGFDVVAIGASAGGVTAIGTLLGGLPPDLQLSLLVVQHLDRRHETVIAEVLVRRSARPVELAQDLEAAKPGMAYVAPPNRHLLIGQVS